VTSRDDIQQFLNDFFVKYRVFGILFRDFRQKNSRALLTLEISPNKRKEIIEGLKVEDYSEGPLDDNLYGIASMWVFGTMVNNTEVYIKISLGNFSSQVICISFHDAEHAMSYPFKNLQP
jgi:hypothetical protein